MRRRGPIAIALVVVAVAVGLLAVGCGGDDRDTADGGSSTAAEPADAPTPLAAGATKATIRDPEPVVTPDEALGKTFYVLTVDNDGTEPFVWGDLRETPGIPADALAFSPGIERDGPYWRYAVSPGLGSSITFSTPLE